MENFTSSTPSLATVDSLTNVTGTATTEISTFAPELTNENGRVTTTSLQVAQHFGKAHNLVMRSIRNLECSAEFRLCNFAQSYYLNDQGRQQPMYRVTKDGFMFLAMGFTGKEAAQWKEAYIMAFNKMEAELNEKLASPASLKKVTACMDAANAIAASVQTTVFQQLMAGQDNMGNLRWMLSFHSDRENKSHPHIELVEEDVFVMSLEYLATAIVAPGGMLPKNTELANLAAACNKRLASRLAHDVARATKLNSLASA